MRFKKIIDKIFKWGIFTKSVFGFFEILGGILFFISDKFITNNFIIYLAQQEIAEDSDDLIANFIMKSANSLANGSQFFAVFYLLFHGAVNIFLAISLFKNKLWAYPSSIGLFGVFVIYQIYRYFHTFSLVLLFLALFDTFIILVIWLEYKRNEKNSKR